MVRHAHTTYVTFKFSCKATKVKVQSSIELHVFTTHTVKYKFLAVLLPLIFVLL